MPVAHDHFLAHLGDAVLDAADADAANELIVVHRGHQHLEGSLGDVYKRQMYRLVWRPKLHKTLGWR